MENYCPICGNVEFDDLDSPLVPCGICSKEKEPKKDCPQCKGKGEFQVTLRNHDFWYASGLLYKDPIGFQCCKNCGFLNYAPRPQDDVFKKINSLQIPVNAIALSKRRQQSLKHFLGGIRHECTDSIPGPVLEVNCGLGYNIDALPNNFFYGIEPNDNYRQYAKMVNNVFFGLEDAEYEMVIVNNLEQQPNPMEYIKEIKKKYLKSDKYFLIDVPLYENEISNQSGKGARQFEMLYHLWNQNCFSMAALENIALLSGFEIIKSYSGTGRIRMLWQDKAVGGEIKKENYNEIKRKIVRQAQSITTFEDGWKIGRDLTKKEQTTSMIMGSLDIYPWHLEGWIGLSLSGDNHKDVSKIHKIYLQAKKYFPKSEALELHFANLFKNWGEPGNETNWIKLARDIYQNILTWNPVNFEAKLGLFYLNILYNPATLSIKEDYRILIENLPEQYNQIMALWITFHQREAQRKRENGNSQK